MESERHEGERPIASNQRRRRFVLKNASNLELESAYWKTAEHSGRLQPGDAGHVTPTIALVSWLRRQKVFITELLQSRHEAPGNLLLLSVTRSPSHEPQHKASRTAKITSRRRPLRK